MNGCSAQEEEEAEAQAESVDGDSQAGGAGPPAKAPVEQERTLSKKELKKKELEDLDAVFAELGINVPVRPATGLSQLSRTSYRVAPAVQRYG